MNNAVKMIKAKISVTLITCVLTLCSCSCSRDMTEEERQKYIEEENRRDLRDLTNPIGF